MEQLSLAQLATALQKKEFSSLELTQHFIRKINKHQNLNVFISIDEYIQILMLINFSYKMLS